MNTALGQNLNVIPIDSTPIQTSNFDQYQRLTFRRWLADDHLVHHDLSPPKHLR